ncbi:MAG: translation initiation factor 1 (eIF-1/SUI1) [Myxococcota bacterium]|jgi:translation initiation factor 1 (eIF-1/SUI1)
MSSFADLLKAKGFEASPKSETVEAEVPVVAEELSFAAKVVVRYTKKGRGGKAVTLVQGVESGADELLAKLKKELGVGARRDEDELVIQGNQVERVARWLESQGVKQVVRS